MARIDQPKAPTRAELAKIIKDPRTLKAFEQVFEVIPSDLLLFEEQIEEVNISSASANYKAIDAISTSIRNQERAQSTMALLWISDI